MPRITSTGTNSSQFDRPPAIAPRHRDQEAEAEPQPAQTTQISTVIADAARDVRRSRR